MNELNDQRSSPRCNSNGFLGYAIHLVGGGITIGLFLVLVWSISASHTRSLIEAERYSAQYADDTDELIKQRCSTTDPVAMASCAADVVRGQHEAQRDEWDLHAQKQMAEWAFWMFIVTLASTAATVIGIWFVRENLIAVREATAGARDDSANVLKVMQSELRPWIKFNHVEVKTMGVTDQGLSINLDIGYNNVGRSPALNVLVTGEMHFAKGMVIAWDFLRKKAGEIPKSVSPWVNTVFPNENQEGQVGFGNHTPKFDGPAYVYIFLSITDSFADLPGVHKTCRLYQIASQPRHHAPVRLRAIDFKNRDALKEIVIRFEQSNTGDYAD